MTQISKKTINELELLFQFVPPEKIRKRIEFLFFNFLSTNADTHDLKEMSEDVYFLMRFLEGVGKNE